MKIKLNNIKTVKLLSELSDDAMFVIADDCDVGLFVKGRGELALNSLNVTHFNCFDYKANCMCILRGEVEVYEAELNQDESIIVATVK